jgi:two-component system cell cycle sensor histidine kinase/response regulator CckA
LSAIDVIMPGINGPDLASRLVNERPSLKVVFMSGYSDHMLAEHHTKVPLGAFLQKPFTPTRLAQLVREGLDVAPV